MTAATFFIKPGYRARTQPEYYADVHDDGTVWQPDVYPLAATLARQYGCRYIIDIGCGRAAKLVKLHPEFEIIGLDFGSNLEYCRTKFPFGNWVDVDLETSTGLAFPEEVLRSSVIINSDVIEHLVDPTNLLAQIREYLRFANVALISTPERDLERGVHDMGPPGNPSHIREWTLSELETLLSSAGLRPAHCGLTISNDRDRQPKTSLAIIPGLRLNSAEVRDLSSFCEKWIESPQELRNSAQDSYMRDLAQLEREVNLLNAAAASSPQLTIPKSTPLSVGTRYIDEAKYEDAFTVLTEGLQAEPENADLIFQLGRLAASCNMQEDARELFYQATLRSPEFTKLVVDFYVAEIARIRSGTF